jgi:H+/Cl- antiporter ClcA
LNDFWKTCYIDLMNLRILSSVKLPILTGVLGIVTGISAALFLFLLDGVTQIRLQHAWLMLGLPVAGLCIGLIDQSPKARWPSLKAPIVFVGTLLTHLCGGSAGREGAVVRIGAGIADQLTARWPVSSPLKTRMIIAGMGAGFAAAIGTPLAGIVFGVEVNRQEKWPWEAFIQTSIAVLCAVIVSVGLHPYQRHLIQFEGPFFSIKGVGIAVVAGLVFGLAARVFVRAIEVVKCGIAGIQWSPLRPVVGGALVLGLWAVIQTHTYAGLSLDLLHQSEQGLVTVWDPLIKGVATALTVGSGFKGGEFVPLVIIGSTLGAVLSSWIPGSMHLFVRLGYVSVFGAASKTPWACSVMACELFGIHIGVYALISCQVAYWISGKKGIYTV